MNAALPARGAPGRSGRGTKKQRLASHRDVGAAGDHRLQDIVAERERPIQHHDIGAGPVAGRAPVLLNP